MRRKLRNRFGRYATIPDGIDTAAVLDRNTDRKVITELPEREAEQLVRDWNRHAKCSCETCNPQRTEAPA